MFKRTKIENKASDAVYLDAEVETLESGSHELKVTLHFSYQTIDVPSGKIAFAVKGGDLRLIGDEIELGKILVSSDFDWFIEQKISKNAGLAQTQKSDRKAVLGLKKEQAEASAEMSHGYVKESTTGAAIESVSQSWQVSSLLGDRPGWRFMCKADQTFLEGNITSCSFAEIVSSQRASSFSLRFSTEQRYIYAEFIEGILRDFKEIDVGKLALIDLLIWHRVVKPLVKPFLSEVVLASETNE